MPTRQVNLKRGELTFLHSGKFLIVCSQCKKETSYNQVANKRKFILIQGYNNYMGKQSGVVEYNNALIEK